MAAQDARGSRSTKDKERAAHLRRIGVFHGMRPSKTNAPPIPNLDDVGSAAYRRLKAKE